MSVFDNLVVPYLGNVPHDDFRRRVMASFGFAAGYDGELQDKNQGTREDERAWWFEGWCRGIAIFENFPVSDPNKVVVLTPVEPVPTAATAKKPTSLF